MENLCDPIFAKKLKVPNETDTNSNYKHQTNRPWFDEVCQVSRDSFYRELNIYKNNKSNMNEKNISSKYDNAKAYWRLLKHAANQNVKHSISAKQFADYFKAINDPDGRFFQVDEDILYFNERYFRGEFQIMFDE